MRWVRLQGKVHYFSKKKTGGNMIYLLFSIVFLLLAVLFGMVLAQNRKTTNIDIDAAITMSILGYLGFIRMEDVYADDDILDMAKKLVDRAGFPGYYSKEEDGKKKEAVKV